MEKLKDNQRISVLFMFYGILFCVCLITANVLETKQISFGPANMTAGLIVFPVSYIINDVVCEVWGYRRTRGLCHELYVCGVWCHRRLDSWCLVLAW